MASIQITLPDGSVQEVPQGTTPADIARKISPRLADAALVARISNPVAGAASVQASGPDAAALGTDDGYQSANAGELIDLRRPLDHNVKLQILTEKDPDSLYVFRHSAAHLLAGAA